MKIPIKTNKERFHRQILELLRSLPPINKLRPKELDLLAEIMKENDSLYELDKDKRRVLIFSTENRKKMRENLNTTMDAFNNNLSILRRHRILSPNNELLTILDIPFSNDFSIELKLVVDANTE